MSDTSKLNNQSNRSGEFWDPFESKVYISEDPSLNDEIKVFLPDYMNKIVIWFLPVGLIGLVYGIFADEDLNSFIGIAIFCISIGIILLVDHLTGTKDKNLKRFKITADQLNYAFRATIPEKREALIKSRVGEFLRLRFGSAVPISVSSEMWGFCSGGETPLWIGGALGESYGVSSKAKAQTIGHKASHYGKFLMFIVAYELDRSTGVRVQLFPEFKTPLGPLDIDIQTESVEFNRKFNIRLSCQENKKNLVNEMSAELLQVLSPAFQTTLIDLADRYAVRIIIDDTSVFFAGYHNLVSDDQNELDEMLSKLVSQLGDAALSFKRFAE